MRFFWSRASEEEQKPPPTIRGVEVDDDAAAARLSNSSAVRPTRKKKSGIRSIEPDLLRFGPVYGDDILVNINAKDLAWKHILDKEGGECSDNYLSSVQKIEQKAKDSYHPTVDLKQTSVFRQKMVTDGCFFLQLALHILGAGDFLDHPDKHPYFGKGKDSTEWLHAMFLVGNQIPYSVILQLMKQPFFKQVIDKGVASGIFRQPPKELPMLVLFLTVVHPQLESPSKLTTMFMSMFRESPPRLRSPPAHILHALHTLLLGPGNDPVYSEIKEFRDLEAGGDDDDGKMKFPSAGELLKLGIRLRVAKDGITGISFRSLVFRAYLYVPPITVGRYSEDMLTSLTSYEQNLNESDREVTAYLRFIMDLAKTYKDFKILQRNGIIRVEEEKFKYTMVQMLRRVVSPNKSNYTFNFRHIRSKIKDFEKPPWGLISFFLALFTIVQTVFSVLSYFWPRK